MIGEQQQLDGVRERQRGEGMPGNSGWAEAPSSRSSGKMKHPKTYDRRQKPVREEDEVGHFEENDHPYSPIPP